MKTTMLKRIEALEKTLSSSACPAIWVEGRNATIRVDINHRRGKEITFSSVYEARVWLEKQIDTHDGGMLSYSVDNICDLCEGAENLKSEIRKIIPGTIVVKDLRPQMVDGQLIWKEKAGPANHPSIYSADELPGDLGVRGMVPGTKADLRWWCLASLIQQYFGNRQFNEHYKAGQLTEEDAAMYSALFIIFSSLCDGELEDQKHEFSYQVFTLGNLPRLEAIEPA